MKGGRNVGRDGMAGQGRRGNEMAVVCNNDEWQAWIDWIAKLFPRCDKLDEIQWIAIHITLEGPADISIGGPRQSWSMAMKDGGFEDWIEWLTDYGVIRKGEEATECVISIMRDDVITIKVRRYYCPPEGTALKPPEVRQEWLPRMKAPGWANDRTGHGVQGEAPAGAL